MRPSTPHTIPVCYFTPTNPQTQMEVSPGDYPLLSQFTWYVSDTRRPSPPKLTIRVNKGGVKLPVMVYVNRLVWLIQTPEHRESLEHQRWWEVVGPLRALPQIRFRDLNPFNVRVENLWCVGGESLSLPSQTTTPPKVLSEPSLVVPPPPRGLTSLPTSDPTRHPTHAELVLAEERLRAEAEQVLSTLDENETVSDVLGILSQRTRETRGVSQRELEPQNPEE